MIYIGPDEHVFVLTGAGISAESGIPTFRGVNGLWRGHKVEEVASPDAWARNPQLVWKFYSERRLAAAKAQPNAAHVAIAKLEKQIGNRLFLCTQNVDNLHEQGGSKRVVHMHGKLFYSRCEKAGCRTRPFEDKNTYESSPDVPQCQHCGGRIRPHICWFGEVPFDLDLIYRALDWCTMFVSIGTSGAVEPAASFVSWVRTRSATEGRILPTIYVGPEDPKNRVFFTHTFNGPAAEVVPGLFQVEQAAASQ